jgi:SulP family sulfate permease
MKLDFRPKLFDTLPGYSRATFVGDLSSGITVGVLALPLAMAFAIASRACRPTAGIWTAIVAGFLIAFLGGSKVQIGGPTGAFIPIIYAIVADLGVQNLLIATMMSGVLLFAMGALRLGNMIRFIPLSVVIGFTNGIAVVIFISQIKDFLGLQDRRPAGRVLRQDGSADRRRCRQLDLPTVAVAHVSLVILVAWNRQAGKTAWMRRLPGPLAVLIILTAVNALIALPVDTIGSRFGGIPQEIPPFGLPELSLSTLGKLIAPAITIALLGAIESLLSARVADSQIDDRHDPNQELMAQGIANVAAPLFGGFAATGAIARTATNIRTGGRTPIAGMMHAGVLLAIVLALAPLASHIPLATLSAIVVMVSINMGDWHAFAPKGARALFAELPHHPARHLLHHRGLRPHPGGRDRHGAGEPVLHLPHVRTSPASTACRWKTSMASRRYRTRTARRASSPTSSRAASSSAPPTSSRTCCSGSKATPRWSILDMDKVINIDTTGLDILQTLHRNLQKRGAHLVLCGLNSQPGSIVFRSGFSDKLGDDNITANLTEALIRAQRLSGREPEIAYA